MKKVYVEAGGAISVKDEPEPTLRPGWYLTDTQYSIISAGTETTHIRNQQKPGVTEARRIGYSNSGVVRQRGEGAALYAPGQLVGCYGGGYADHQSVCAVPETLVCPAPKSLTPRQAAFAGMCTFGLNGLRVCDLTFGETVAMIGMGLIGQLTAQIAEAAGFRTVCLSRSDKLLELATELGCHGTVNAGADGCVEKAKEIAVELGGAPDAPGRPGGFDAALICSGSSDTNRDLLLAMDLIREGGAVSIVGGVKQDFPRGAFFARQARLVIARAAGVGRYDPHHEYDAEPIPHSHARWTEGRNCAEVLRMIGDGKLNVDRLITHEFQVTEAAEAYDTILNKPRDCLAVMLKYTE
jgi:threonine dehydrogenase-like Zn-dependent dehydrogenase